MTVEKANAKINVFLDVLSKRENGYHNIASLMHTVSLCDLVTVEYHPSAHTEIFMRASGNDRMPTNEKNLAWRAAACFLEKIGREATVEIFIEKRIPMAAGLAGGSADAAAVLRALNRLCGSPLSCEELCELGVKIGADVPFCIVGGSALVEGIGDVLTKAPQMPCGHLLVACKGEGVSTPWAYGELDRIYHDFVPARVCRQDAQNAIFEAWSRDDLCASSEYFFNLFEEVVPRAQPHVAPLKRTMYDCGAVCAMMSGSGPSVFGVFKSEAQAKEAQRQLSLLGAAAYLCGPASAYEKI